MGGPQGAHSRCDRCPGLAAAEPGYVQVVICLRNGSLPQNNHGERAHREQAAEMANRFVWRCCRAFLYLRSSSALVQAGSRPRSRDPVGIPRDQQRARPEPKPRRTDPRDRVEPLARLICPMPDRDKPTRILTLYAARVFAENVARVTDTVVPFGPAKFSTLASSCCASALTILVPSPTFA
jgi:hypothetical protein